MADRESGVNDGCQLSACGRAANVLPGRRTVAYLSPAEPYYASRRNTKMRKRLIRVLTLALLGVVGKSVRKKIQQRNERRVTHSY
jgi:hypothetical protein